MHRLSPLFAVLAVALCACGGPIVAVETVDHSFTTESAPQVVVRSFNGRIDVTTGAEDEVKVTVRKSARGWSEEDARRNLPHVVIIFTESAHTVTIDASRVTPTAFDAAGAEMTLTVPPGASLDLTTNNGDVSAEGTGGRIVAVTSNGDIALSGGADEIRATSSNGGVRITPLGPATVIAESSNGDVEFHGALSEGVSTFETSNGRVDLFVPADSAFHLDADTSNGTATCGLQMIVTRSTSSTLHADIGSEPHATVRATSSNGSIRVMPMAGP